jgi:hypothetical protein
MPTRSRQLAKLSKQNQLLKDAIDIADAGTHPSFNLLWATGGGLAFVLLTPHLALATGLAVTGGALATALAGSAGNLIHSWKAIKAGKERALLKAFTEVTKAEHAADEALLQSWEAEMNIKRIQIAHLKGIDAKPDAIKKKEEELEQLILRGPGKSRLLTLRGTSQSKLLGLPAPK